MYETKDLQKTIFRKLYHAPARRRLSAAAVGRLLLLDVDAVAIGQRQRPLEAFTHTYLRARMGIYQRMTIDLTLCVLKANPVC